MDEGWIEKIIKKNMPSEKSLEDISKQMLAHNLQVKIDELKTYDKSVNKAQKICFVWN